MNHRSAWGLLAFALTGASFFLPSCSLDERALTTADDKMRSDASSAPDVSARPPDASAEALGRNDASAMVDARAVADAGTEAGIACAACPGPVSGEGTPACEDGGCAIHCRTGLVLCGRDSCVDLASDGANCGTCGKACGAGLVCQAGQCGTSCAGGLEPCGSSCVDLTSNPDDCGGCDIKCPRPPVNGSAACQGGGCQINCLAGLAACGAACVDTKTDSANCGGCGNACGGVCQGGVCCPAGQTNCGGTCVDLKTSATNCGACNQACAGVCSGGLCCPAGQTNCGGTCVDLKTSATSCGACNQACAGTCSDGVCCPQGQVSCAGTCVDTKVDLNHCGRCGNACAGVCSSGLCCPAGQTNCSGTCVDARSSAANCGACGRACTTGMVCQSSTCATDCGTLTACGTSCVDLASDVAHCGNCTTSCAGPPANGSPVCQTRACQIQCATNFTLCADTSTCVNTRTDPANCGACHMACATGSSCSSGVCCPAGQTNCSGTCFNLATTNAHCGTCTTACTTGQICTAGACVAQAMLGIVAVTSTTFDPTPPGITSPTTRSFTVTNGGGVSAGTTTGLAVTSSNPMEFIVSQGTCGTTLGAGASCTVVVSFRPSTTGTRTATLSASAAPGGNASLSAALTGVGQTPAVLTLAVPAGSSADYGVVAINTSKITTFTLSNSGQQASSALTPGVSGTDYVILSGAAGDCASAGSLAGGASCNLRVQFRPVSMVKRAGSLAVSPASGTAPTPIALTGRVYKELATLPLAARCLGNAPDGNFWMCGQDAAGNGVVMSQSPLGVVRQFTVSSPDEVLGSAIPYKIVRGPDANLWLPLTNNDVGQIARISTGGVRGTTLFEGGNVSDLILSPDGNSAWCADVNQGAIFAINASGTIVGTFPVSFNASGLVMGPDNAVWITGGSVFPGLPDTIARMTAAGAVTNTISATGPRNLIAGPDSSLYFAEYPGNPPTSNNRIGRITTAGTITEITVPAPPNGLVSGPDAGVWFTETAAGRLGRITPPAGPVVEFTIPIANSAPTQMIVGPDGNLWFIETAGTKLGSVTP